jgi:hypothetical protein
VYTICTRYRLSNHDIEDVGQNVWLLLVEQLGKLREPAALPGWPATTTARECLRVVTAASKAGRLGIPVGSIGPQRARCLERLRRSDTLAALAEGEEKIDIRGGERVA